MSFSNRFTINIDGVIAINSTINRSGDGRIGKNPALPAAVAGTLSTRTSDTAGTLTLAALHGIQDGDVIDIYWAAGRAYRATVGTVAGNDVPFTAALGDVLPAEDTAVTAAVQTEVDIDLDCDQLVSIAAMCPKRACVAFYDDTTLELLLDLVAGEVWFWIDGGTAVNPLAGKTLTHLVVSQAEAAETVLKLDVLHDATP